ncbi:fibronectin type III domain-containing protein [Spirosoma aureum]|uniref:Fibronectin type III domain-containing protein n=1 Tax=Spirosoma aureum TaxID=2692134 RepID=A0A6G9AK72_9BACT|nr:fibronectin type III domain-containing protein [Spirosoma aureum]QIP12716.1 fibronectin type III domain-containing protein [Spirosoma aureum]
MKNYLFLLFLGLVSTRIQAQSNAPSNLQASSVTYNQVNLTWNDNSSNETKFEIERQGFTGTFSKIGEASANSPSYQDKTVTSLNTYSYRVRAVFVTNSSVYSNTLTVNTTQETPGVPTGLTAIPQSSNSIKLTWTNGSGSAPTDYRIERGTTANGTFTLLQTVAYSRTPTFTDNGVSGGQPYCYRIRSQIGSLVSDFTAAVCATPPLAPTNVNNLKATALSSSSIKLTWDRYGKENSISIERRIGQTGNWSKVSATTSDLAEFTDNGLNGGTEYCYRIAEDGHDYSGTACATTQQSAPKAPGRLTANTVSSSQIDLQWADLSDNETGFQVERASSPTASFSKIADLGANTTTYTDQSLQASTPYCYRVRAVNNTGASDYTDVQCAATQAPPVGAPQNLAATVASTTQINLTWTGVSGTTTYQLERSPNGNDNWAKIADPVGNATSYTDTGLTPNTSYYYRLRAVIGGNTGPYSNVANASTPDVPPAAPARLSATVISFSQINLQWADLSGNEAGFQLERSPNGVDSWTKITDLGTDVTSYSDQVLSPQTHYYYRVRAVNAAGPSPYSNTADATTPVGPPGTPQNLVTSAVSITQINLTWNTVSTAVNVLIERSLTGNDGWTQIASVSGDATAYEDKNLTQNTRYYYRIRGTNASGTGPYSTIANASTPDSPPAAPARLTAMAISTNQINLTWADLSTNEGSFEIERGTTATGNFTKIADAPTNATTYEDRNLTDNTPYCYRIRAKNAAGPSAYTDAACATTPLAPPATPTNLVAQVSDYDQIRLNWNAPGVTAVTVSIERSTSPAGPFVEIKQQPATQTTYTDAGLLEFTTYYYRIRAINQAGNSGASNVAQARIEEIIIAVEDEWITQTQVFVVDRTLHIQTDWHQSSQAQIQLHSMSGRVDLTDTRRVTPATAWSYSLAGLPTGLYVVAIVAEGRIFSKRILLP